MIVNYSLFTSICNCTELDYDNKNVNKPQEIDKKFKLIGSIFCSTAWNKTFLLAQVGTGWQWTWHFPFLQALVWRKSRSMCSFLRQGHSCTTPWPSSHRWAPMSPICSSLTYCQKPDSEMHWVVKKIIILG